MKFIPFQGISEVINEQLAKIPKVGKFFAVGYPLKIMGIPIIVKISWQASGDLAFFPSKLQVKTDTPVADDVVINFFKQTNAYQQGVMDLKTSMTAASAAKVIDLGFCKLVFKLDLFILFSFSL